MVLLLCNPKVLHGVTRNTDEATLKRRGSGVSIALSKSPSRVGTRPNSLERTAVQEYQDWQTGYPQPAGPYPILVNPPPMPTVKTNVPRLINCM